MLDEHGEPTDATVTDWAIHNDHADDGDRGDFLDDPDREREFLAAHAPAPVTRCFTFGYGHTDPRTGESLAERYATITASSAETCRAVMLALFGRHWAFEYADPAAVAAKCGPGVREYARVSIGG